MADDRVFSDAPLFRTGPVVRQHVEFGALLKFARATGQTDPLFIASDADVPGAGSAIVAPPTFVGTFCNEALAGVFDPRPEHDMFLHSADRVRLFTPIRPGDTIEVRAELRSVEERVGRYGPTTVQLAAIELANQNGQCVATIQVEMRSFCAGEANG